MYTFEENQLCTNMKNKILTYRCSYSSNNKSIPLMFVIFLISCIQLLSHPYWNTCNKTYIYKYKVTQNVRNVRKIYL